MSIQTFTLGNVSITGDINSLRELVEDVKSSIGDGNELPSYLADVFYSIELAYQTFHGLSEHDYSYYPENN
jgi:hypothetical protein